MEGKEPISNTQDTIDSREVIARINYLEGTEDEKEQAELKALEALAEEAQDSPDWEYGETLIREGYFEEYARELAEDTGAIDSQAGWPLYCINWEYAARELKMDYMAVDFDGVTYYIRS